MKKTFEHADVAQDITQSEWEVIIKTVRGTNSERAIDLLHSNKNTPTAARDLFDPVRQNSGQTYSNSLFLRKGIPFLLTRIGRLEAQRGRCFRLLALVRRTE